MNATNYIGVCLLAVALVAVGCDKSESEGGEATATESGEKAVSGSEPTVEPGVWTIGRVNIERGASTEDAELPGEGEVRTWIESAVEQAKRLELGDTESAATLTYEAAVVDGVSGIPEDEQPFLIVRVRGQLQDPRRSDAVNNLVGLGIERDASFEAGGAKPTPAFVADKTRAAIEEYIAITDARVAVLGASEAELVDTLEAGELAPEALLTAIHEARDRELESAVPALTGQLAHESPAVVVAAAAALTTLAPETSATAIVEAAGRLGRQREYAALHRLIYIIGDIDAPVVTEYLEGLTGHKIPDIRRAATQVLEQREGSP